MPAARPRGSIGRATRAGASDPTARWRRRLPQRAARVDADAATLVWLAPAAPDADEARALSSFGRARGLRLVQPRDEALLARNGLPLDPAIGEDVEQLLDRAHDALAAHDGEAVDRLLRAAASTLGAHPEAPQAAWLMAEVERARSTRLRRLAPVDEAAAASAWTRAEALDGGRLPGVGEQGSASPPAATLTLPAGLATGATTVLLDGSRVTGASVATRAGPHALVVEQGGAVVWASWIEAPAGTSAAQVTAPLAAACSRADVARASLTGETIDATDVACPSWIAATAGAAGPAGVRVAVCEGHHCGALLPWRAPLPWTYDLPPERPASRSPAWAAWGLVGAGAVITTGIVILATGVLKPAPTGTQFVAGGVRSR